MKTVQYGDWKIAVDVDETSKYYENYVRNETQANRNYEVYCENLSDEESAFFDELGIDPVCCEIEHIGANKKGEFPCGGYYFICGKYIEFPPEELMSVEELVENNFVDDRDDPCIYVGNFQFDFQCEAHEMADIPEDMPDGFICLRFWCEEMKWLLEEKPESMMYEPPHFWEIHKIIREKLEYIRDQKADLEETKLQFAEAFEGIGAKAASMEKKQVRKYKSDWLGSFAPEGAEMKELKGLCLKGHGYTPFLWHIFSFEKLECDEREAAEKLFNEADKKSCVLLSNVDEIAYRLEDAEGLTAEMLEQFTDVTVTAADFSWTYVKTHEDMCGPYFYVKQK